ncbi:MAG: hypothetical protein AAF998_26735 [Bacteroidota bacterium]
MEKSNRAQEAFDASDLLLRLWHWRIVLAAVTGIAFGVTLLVVKLTTPLYESHAILYPTLSSNREKQVEEFAYGYEIHSERLMQLLSSDAILDSVNARYDLVSHYGIDRDNQIWYDQFLRQARERIQFHKTQYTSIAVSVMDEEPELASSIANDISHIVNNVNAQIVKSNAREILQAVEGEYKARQQRVVSINDSIFRVQEGAVGSARQQLQRQIAEQKVRLREIQAELNRIQTEYKMYDYAHQINVLNTELALARANYLQESGRLEIFSESPVSIPDSTVLGVSAAQKGAERRVQYFEEQLNQLTKAGSRYNALKTQLEQENELLTASLKELGNLKNTPEPEINSRQLQALEKDYDWDQLQTLELRQKYQQALSNYLEPAPAAYLISRARPSYIKIYPKTLPSLVLASLGTFFLTAILILFYERIKKGGLA